jgi:DNA-binding MarR family transcriptional regulator
MAAFQDTREHTEQKVMVHLFTEIERNPSITQRGLAAELGIALGLMNQYIQRCVTKGWIRASQISPKRITYFLTPEGFKEKSEMVTGYLSRSLTFFRDSRNQCEEAFAFCVEQKWLKVALLGAGDLADIARLVALGTGINASVISNYNDLQLWDAVLITDIMNPQGCYDAIKDSIENKRILTLNLLHISRTGVQT